VKNYFKNAFLFYTNEQTKKTYYIERYKEYKTNNMKIKNKEKEIFKKKEYREKIKIV
jgi:hypothetical protein